MRVDWYLQTLLVADNSAADALPLRIRLTFNVTTGSDVTAGTTMTSLELERNDRVQPRAPVVTGHDGSSVIRAVELDRSTGVRQYMCSSSFVLGS